MNFKTIVDKFTIITKVTIKPGNLVQVEGENEKGKLTLGYGYKNANVAKEVAKRVKYFIGI